MTNGPQRPNGGSVLPSQIVSRINLLALLALVFLLTPGAVFAAEGVTRVVEGPLRQVEQYNFSIHILAMLLVGFGFLMVFVRNYGYSATTGTYLVVAIGLPLYLLLRSSGKISAEAIAPESIKAILLAEFAGAAALISMGAILGRVRLYQYAILGLLAVPAYMLNEWLVLDGGLGVTKGFVDSAGSIVIHAFGAYFGLGLAVALTRPTKGTSPSKATKSRTSFRCWDRWCCGFSGRAFAARSCRRSRCPGR